jgi:flagellar biosynthesis protein
MNNPNAPRQAIALKYDGTHAPTLTAKGDEALAEEILRIARDCEVPIYENAELVRLLARMELGDSIPQELYLTIAEIIAFAWSLKGKFPAGMGPDALMVEKDVTESGDDY